AHLLAPEQRLDPVVEDREPLRHVAQPLHVREVAADLDCEEEAARALGDPVRDGLALGQAVEGRVHLDRVEEGGVVLEPAARRQPFRVDQPAPVGVVPPGAADADSACASSRHSALFPAATTRERPSTSSGAAPNGGVSKRSIARPRSRTRSWAAAMSTERAGFSEQTPSSRPEARWQSEIASEPMIRSRWATPTTE